MPLFSSRPRADGVEGILQIISMGDCDDQTIRQLQALVEGMSDDDVRSLADSLMANLVKYPDDIDVLAGSVRALEALPYLPKAKNEFIITLLVSLLKAPVNKKDALLRKTLKSEVVKYLLFFVVEDDSYARLMMPELISALDDTHGTISSSVFHTLQRLATDKPEYFEHHSAALIKQLGSINKSTRAASAKVIGLIAKAHPEYVSNAMPFLQSLASFYPDAHVKRNANEAFQIIARSVKKEAPVTSAARKEEAAGKGFADIVKLNAGSPGGGMAEVQFTDEELREIIELTRKEFKSDAEAILNSLGVGHLAVNGKAGRKKAVPKAAPHPAETPKAAAAIEAAPAPAPAPAPVPAPQAKPKKAEKAFAAPQTGIASAIKQEAKVPDTPKVEALKLESHKAEAPRPETQKLFRPRAAGPEPAQASPKRLISPGAPAAPVEQKKEAKTPIALMQAALPGKPAEARVPGLPKTSIVDAIMHDVKAPEIRTKPVNSRGDPKAGRTYKCPRCGKHVWAEGQLCNACGAEEFDSMRLKGHFDIS